VTADEIKALVERVREVPLASYEPLCADVIDALEALLQDIEDLRHDNASMLGSLTKESVARCEAEDLLGEAAALKRHDPNGVRGFKRSTITLNVPHGLLERIDAALKDKP
jgi:hypothetical protein